MFSSFWLLQNRGEHRQTWAAVIPLWRRRLDLRHPFLLLALLPVPSSFSSCPAAHLLRWHRSHGPAGRDSVRTAPSTRTPSIPLETNTRTHKENTHQQRGSVHVLGRGFAYYQQSLEGLCIFGCISLFWRLRVWKLDEMAFRKTSTQVYWILFA